jgi:phosphoglycolate phosphatase
MAATAKQRLVLWDIDHTLVETRGVGRRLYELAFQTVTGRPVQRDVEVTGRTEQAIFAEALRLHDIQATADVIQAYAAELTRQYEQHIDELRTLGRALLGAAQTLAAMASLSDVVQSVLTGNIRAVARVKLDVYDLSPFIDLHPGAFGDDNPERAKLVAIGQRRAATKYGADFTHHNTIVIGDYINNIIAAHDGGARIVAVTTGRDDADSPRAAGADVVLPGLADTSAVVNTLTGTHSP